MIRPLNLGWVHRGVLALRRVANEGRLRVEVGWVVVNNAAEFCLSFALLKVLTSLLGKQGFGEYNLAETAVLLVSSVILSPLNESYLRDYHGASERGEGRSSGLLLIRWYVCATVGCAVVAALLTKQCAQWFDVGRWTTLAAGLVFLFLPWRVIGQEILNIRRDRRPQTLRNMAYLALLAGMTWVALFFWRATPSTALFAYAGVAAVFALVEGIPIVRQVLRLPVGPRGRLMPLMWSFGVPYGALLVFQWTQGFTDRYLLKAMMDLETVGLYVAAYQVCGIPYMLLLRVCHSLLRPIAYERGRDRQDARGIWGADKVLLSGIAFQTLAGLPMILVYAVFGQRLLVLLTSQQFQIPTTTIIILTLSRFVQSIAMAVQPIFAVHHRMVSMLWFRLVGAIFTVAICWYAVRSYGVVGAAAGSLGAFSLYLLTLIFAPNGCFWLISKARKGVGFAPPTSGGMEFED